MKYLLIIIVITFLGCASKKSKVREQEKLQTEWESQNKTNVQTEVKTDTKETVKEITIDSTGSQTEIVTEFKEVTQPDGTINSVPIRKTEKRTERGRKTINSDKVKDISEKKSEELKTDIKEQGKQEFKKVTKNKEKKPDFVTGAAWVLFLLALIYVLWRFLK